MTQFKESYRYDLVFFIKNKQRKTMKKLNTVLAAIAIAAFTMTNVFAGNASLGIVASQLAVDATGTETDRITAAGANIADTSVRTKTIDETTTTLSFFGEWTSATSYPITFGFEYTPGEANISDKLSRTDTELSQSTNVATTALTRVVTAEADATNFSTAYVELPLFKGLYFRGGISNIDIDYATTDTGINGGKYSDVISLAGTNLGIGWKMTTEGGTLIKLSYEDTDYDAFSLRSTGNSVAANSNAISGDIDTTSYRLSLGKTF